MRTKIIMFILLISTGLFALSDQEILLDYAQDNKEIREYKLVENADIYFLKGISKNEEEEYLFISSEQDEVRGYQSNNKVIITLNSDKVIKHALLVKSKDTPSFVKRIKRSKFFTQFIGWNGEDKIQAITGATITCNSVKATIENLLNRIEEAELLPN